MQGSSRTIVSDLSTLDPQRRKHGNKISTFASAPFPFLVLSSSASLLLFALTSHNFTVRINSSARSISSHQALASCPLFKITSHLTHYLIAVRPFLGSVEANISAIVKMRESFFSVYILWLFTATAFAPIHHRHKTKDSRVAQIMTRLYKNNNNDFAKIFGKQEAAERKQEEADRFVEAHRGDVIGNVTSSSVVPKTNKTRSKYIRQTG